MADVNKDEALQNLRQASEGLLFLSETDAPFEAFFWADEKTAELTPEAVASLAGAPADASVKSVKLEAFFRPAVKEEEWHNEEEKVEVERFKALLKTIKETLKGVKVFRIGDAKIDVYIVGQVTGGYAGLKTHVVET